MLSAEWSSHHITSNPVRSFSAVNYEAQRARRGQEMPGPEGSSAVVWESRSPGDLAKVVQPLVVDKEQKYTPLDFKSGPLFPAPHCAIPESTWSPGLAEVGQCKNVIFSFMSTWGRGCCFLFAVCT